MISTWIRVGSESKEQCPCKRQKRRNTEWEVLWIWKQDWNNATISQETSKIANHHEQRERCGVDSPSEPPRGTNPANTFYLGLLALRTVRKYICCLSHPARGNLPWQPQEAQKPSEERWELNEGFKEVKWFVQNHWSRSWSGWYSDPGLLEVGLPLNLILHMALSFKGHLSPKKCGKLHKVASW